MAGHPCGCKCAPDGCTCTYGCANDAAPCCLKVVVAGIANDGCTDCAQLNTSFYLRHKHNVGRCQWIGGPCKTFPETSICGFYYVVANLVVNAYSGNYELEVWFVDAYGPNYIRWVVDLGAAKPDCTAWSDLALALDAANTTGTCCDASASTCKVSATSRSEARCGEGVRCVYEGQCWNCKNGLVAQRYQVVLDGPGSGDDCNEWHGTYLMPVVVTCGLGCSTLLYHPDINMAGKCDCDPLSETCQLKLHLEDPYSGTCGPVGKQRLLLLGGCMRTGASKVPGFEYVTTGAVDCVQLDDSFSPIANSTGCPSDQFYQDMTCHVTAIPAAP